MSTPTSAARRRRMLALLPWAALLLTSCGTLEVYRYPLGSAAPPRGPVAVHFEGFELPSSLREVALVEVLGDGTKANQSDVLAAMVQEAGQWGATDLVRVKIECALGQCHGIGIAVVRVP